jgi:large subunit ribosomal protein L9
MEVILLQDIDKVGDKHTIVSVKNGYGRNFLIPQGFALIANQPNRNRLTEMVRQDERRESKRLDEFKVIVSQLQGKTIKVSAKAGTSGRIFGSVSNATIATAIKEQLDVVVERKKISFSNEVKELGTHTANIQLSKEVGTTIQVEVEAIK